MLVMKLKLFQLMILSGQKDCYPHTNPFLNAISFEVDQTE